MLETSRTMATIQLIVFALFLHFCIALAKNCRAPGCTLCEDAFDFMGDNVVECATSKGLAHRLSEISVCYWMNTKEDYIVKHSPTILSYATVSNDNEFVIWIRKDMVVSRAGTGRLITNTSLADGKDHHVCVMWAFSAGKLDVYVDGLIRYSTSLEAVDVLHRDVDGVWVIGQEQDTPGGGFDSKSSYKGMVAELNIWDRVLTPEYVQQLSESCCHDTPGDVKHQKEFTLEGGTKTFEPHCCYY